MKRLASEMKLKIVAKVANENVTMCVDGWTNCRHRKMLNVCIIVKGEAYFWESVEVDKNNGDRIFEVLQSAKTECEGLGMVVVAVVGDTQG